jgi:predicted ATPase/DNA-binding SARP family transcriptional activator
VEFRILGLLEVVDGDRPAILPAAKAKMLLAMLVCRVNSVVSADELTEGLWGDSPPASAANTLQTYVSQLRKALGASVIATRSPGYVLTVDPSQIDAVRFERLVDEGRRLLRTDPSRADLVLEEALHLWRGPVLADFTFDSFASAEIARLEELRLVALEERMEAELALGRHDQLAGRLRRLVGEHPLRERFWSQLMVALYRSGRQAEALRTYGELRRTMRAELGIEPSPSLRRLEEAMVIQEPQLEWRPAEPVESAPPVPSNLPLARSVFVGRESELADLKKTLERRGLVTLVGPPGVGKSRLASEAARQLLDENPDGVWLAELFAVNDESRVPEAVADAIGGGGAEPWSIAQLADHMRAQRALVVLDGCEHLVEPTAVLVDAMLRASSDLAVLVTSREPLRAEGETVMRLSPMPTPQRDDLPPFDLIEFDSVRLFVELSGLSESDLAAEGTAAVIARICRRLDGLPLAIELAAARTRSLSPRQLCDRLDDALRVLTSGSRSGPVHHRSLKAAVDWSYDWLPEPERALLRRLSVFPGQFRLEDAEALCVDAEMIASSTLELLCSLADRSLVSVTGQDGDALYRLQETLRRYAADRLKETEEEETIRRLPAGAVSPSRLDSAGRVPARRSAAPPAPPPPG